MTCIPVKQQKELIKIMAGFFKDKVYKPLARLDEKNK